MKHGLSLGLGQQLALTPQLRQSIRLLQLSTLELEQEVVQMLQDNPMLELDEEDDASADLNPENGQPDAAQALASNERFESNDAPAGDEDEDKTALLNLDELSDVPWSEWQAGDMPSDRAQESENPHEGLSPAEDAQSWGEIQGHKDGDSDPGDWCSAPENLGEHLRSQARHLRLSPQVQAALCYLIDSLNEDGYLCESLPELLAQVLNLQVADLDGQDPAVQEMGRSFEVALQCLQGMDPAGVGARHVSECLYLQLLHSSKQADLAGAHAHRLALQICSWSTSDWAVPGAHHTEEPVNSRFSPLPSPVSSAVPSLVPARSAHVVLSPGLDLLAKRDFKTLAKRLQCHVNDIEQAHALIRALNPKPAHRFTAVAPNAISPDVSVRCVQGQWRVDLQPEAMPRLRINPSYAQTLREYGGDQAHALQQQLQSARWFIKSLEQRVQTILRVSQAIVERQKRFFEQGALAMRPLVLREIADELGLHESTVSRVTSAKYMSTPWGTFELKYFFSSGLATESGGSTSSTAVRTLIRQLIAAENPTQPLSDQKLAELLQAQGIACARRTVAKYREALKIAPAALRRHSSV